LLGPFDRCQAVLTSGQLGGQFIAATTTQGSVLRLVLPGRLGHQDLHFFTQALHFLLHIPVTHRLVTRRIALDFRAVGRHVTQLHQPRLAHQTDHLHKHVHERIQMQLAKIAEGAEIRTVLAHNGHEGQIAFARLRDLTAGKHPHAVGIEPQADHHRRIKGRGTPGFLLIRRIETA
jgi:hypothetical protein